MVNGFLHQSPNLPEMPLEQGPARFGFVRPDAAGQGVHLRAQSASPTQGNQAAMEAAFNAPPGTQFSAEDFSRFQQMNNPASSSRASPMAQQQHHQNQHQGPMMGMGMSGMGMNYGMGRPMYQPMFSAQSQMPQHFHQTQEPEGKGKGKEKIIELDDNQWEEQFAQIELQDKNLKEGDESLAMEPELNAMDDNLMHSETGYGDLESIWKGIQAEQEAMRGLDEEEDFAKFDCPAPFSL